jgi:hypothetical protein
MTCWHCESELVFKFEMGYPSKFYHCSKCEKWYEMRKEKERINGAVPVRFLELETTPSIPAAVMSAAA